MNELRKKFEALPNISVAIKRSNLKYNPMSDSYTVFGKISDTQLVSDLNFVGEAWWVFRESKQLNNIDVVYKELLK